MHESHKVIFVLISRFLHFKSHNALVKNLAKKTVSENVLILRRYGSSRIGLWLHGKSQKPFLAFCYLAVSCPISTIYTSLVELRPLISNCKTAGSYDEMVL